MRPVAVFLLFLFLLSCTTSDKRYTDLSRLLPDQKLLAERPNVLLVSANGCKGCMQGMLTQFIEEAPEEKKNKTVVLIDTIQNQSFDYIKESLYYVHVPQEKLEEVYPVIVNVMFIKTKDERIVFQRDFTSSGDTSHLVSFY